MLDWHILGRTRFDKDYINSINKECKYYHVNETLRKSFYNEVWKLEECNRHEIFLSQGNYPLKGAHTAIEAVGILKDRYPDIKLYIAGDKITGFESIKEKLKIFKRTN